MNPFPPRDRRLADAERQHAGSFDKGHGRIERRRITSTTALKGYSDWPGLEQVFELERQRTVHGKTTTEMAYGITSLPRELADARALLNLCRSHWGIENNLFRTRDMTFGEDACRVRSGTAPQILAALRNMAIRLLHSAGASNKAAALRRNAAHPYRALALIHDTS
jgi:predicted transposase YbfD/YdcC